MTRRIGVVGGSGEVGRAAVGVLREWGDVRLRVGGRRIDAVDAVVDDVLGGEGDAVRVDATDPASLAEFCAGLDGVLNCAGPTYRLRDTVAVAALRAGAHYADVAGDDPARDGLLAKGFDAAERTAVLSAGTLPGLSSIVPRWLASEMDQPVGLVAYAGGVEACSPTVAEDMMLSLETGGADGGAFGEPLAAWRAGGRRSRALRAADRGEAPEFPGRVALQPLLSAESERLARGLGLSELDWWNVWPGEQVWSVLNALPSLMGAGTPRERIAERMIRAAALDLSGRTPYYRMVFTMTGVRDGAEVARTAVVRARHSYRLTALVGAMAISAAVAGHLPPGPHFACEVLDPAAVVAELEKAGAISAYDGAPDTDEGEL